MRVVKPQQLGVLLRTYEDGANYQLVVSVLVFFRLTSSRSLVSEQEFWPFAAAELGRDGALDAGMPKSRGEVLLTATAYPRDRIAQPVCSVRVQLGAIDKTLQVTGNRCWKNDAPTAPEPFAQMRVSYEHAFGGADYPRNPLGKGHAPVPVGDHLVHELPNIEDPKRLIRSSSALPDPAGFGPYDFAWPQRSTKLGTYDNHWLETRFPGFAKDMDWGLWNAAPEDQRIDGYFEGDESLRIENMHPAKPVLAANLPGVVGRAFLNQKAPDGEVFREVALRIDTVHLFPHAEQGALVFRGTAPVADDDAADVLQLLIGCDDRDAARPVQHFRHALERRLDKEIGHLSLLQDADLLPASGCGERSESTASTEIAKLLATEGHARKRGRARAERAWDKARQGLRDRGLDPDTLGLPSSLPPEEPEPALDELPAYVERQLAKAKELESRAEQRRTAGAALPHERGGPPVRPIEPPIDKLRQMLAKAQSEGTSLPELEAMLADPEVAARSAALADEAQASYRRQAQHFPPAVRGADEGRMLRTLVTTILDADESLAGRDLTGADLSGLDLRGKDLHGALLEGANLAATDLRGADLSEAVFVRADLTGARLGGAKLHATNLARARLVDADLSDAGLEGATLSNADLSGASLRRADITGAELSEALLAGADLERVTAVDAVLIKADCTGANLRGAQMRKAVLIETNLSGATFDEADLASAVLLNVSGAGARFRKSMLVNLRVVGESNLEGADFRGARLETANPRGCRLTRADFTGANLDGADLSECDLRAATLTMIAARDARFVRAELTGAFVRDADLLQASFQKADLRGADFGGASLFRADLARITVDDTTRFDDADLQQARRLPRRSDAQV